MRRFFIWVILLMFSFSIVSCGTTKPAKIKKGSQWIEGHYKVIETPQGPKRIWIKGHWE
ncbi:MAG: hypothetical protein AB1765_12615 [Candidatus Hydrogenedentota bacterium]